MHSLSPEIQKLARSSASKRSVTWYVCWTLFLLLLVGSWQGADMRPMELIRDSGNMAKYAAEFFPPNFSQWRMYVDEMLVTLQIAICKVTNISSTYIRHCEKFGGKNSAAYFAIFPESRINSIGRISAPCHDPTSKSKNKVQQTYQVTLLLEAELLASFWISGERECIYRKM